jgi:spermidine/putrescine transport system permease protein
MKKMKWLKGIAIGVLLFLWVPLAMMLSRGFSVEAFDRLFGNPEILLAFRNSIFLATVSSTLAVLMGSLTAAALPRIPALSKRLMGSGLVFPMLLPEISFALAMMVWCIKIGIPLGWSSMTLGHFAYLFPFATLIMKGHFETLDPSLLDAVRDLGGKTWALIRHGIIPQIFPGLIAAFSTCFLLSIDDFFVSFFVKGVDQITLPIKIYSMLRLTVGPEIYALSLLLFCLSLLAVLLSQIWWQQKLRKP